MCSDVEIEVWVGVWKLCCHVLCVSVAVCLQRFMFCLAGAEQWCRAEACPVRGVDEV